VRLGDTPRRPSGDRFAGEKGRLTTVPTTFRRPESRPGLLGAGGRSDFGSYHCAVASLPCCFRNQSGCFGRGRREGNRAGIVDHAPMQNRHERTAAPGRSPDTSSARLPRDADPPGGEKSVFSKVAAALDRCRRNAEHLRTEDEFRGHVVCAAGALCKKELLSAGRDAKNCRRRLTSAST